MSKTYTQKPAELKRDWKIIDASGQSLGRLASHVAGILMGKHKAEFSPHILGGDFVIVINSDKIKLTGKKWIQKIYYTHSRFVGSLKEKQAKDIPTPELIKKAIQGMLPKNSLRPKTLKRLKVFKNANHHYENKKPETLTI